MKYLIIYDLDGNILMQQGSSNPIKPRGVPSIIVNKEELQGKRILGVDVSTQVHKLILEDLPKTKEQTIEDKILMNRIALAELLEKVEQEKQTLQQMMLVMFENKVEEEREVN